MHFNAFRFQYYVCLIAFTCLLSIPNPARAGLVTTVAITVDTSAIAGGTAGNLYFSFNPGIGIVDSATATIQSFTMTHVAYSGNELLDGDATSVANGGGGPVPNDYVIQNTSVLNNPAGSNDASFDVAFNTPPSGASSLSFVVALTGAAIDSPDPNSESGSVFSFQLTGTALAGYPPLLGAPEVVGFLLPVGSNIPILTRQAPEATVIITTPNSGAAVPEPSNLFSAFVAMALPLLLRRRPRCE